ncbi:MAG: sigma 54-interacting transcriptional regulator [bacterium]
MGPKGYRVCWLGSRRERMQSVLPETPQTEEQYLFLPYPGSDPAQLKEIHPCLFIMDIEEQAVSRKESSRWISACRESSPRSRILLITPNGASRYTNEGLLSGADWIFPQDDGAHLRFCIRSLIAQHRAERDVFLHLVENYRNHLFEDMIGVSSIMKDLFRIIRKCAPCQANILIQGESGTGKELVARAIHRLSRRRGGNLVCVNCAALNEGIHQSELFGHEKGAFTDAKSRRIGYFEAAHGGTLFLDEIGDVSPRTQVVLLRVIEGKEFFRVGGEEPIRVDVRVIAATNQNLQEMVREGRFREDLFFRLNGFSLTIPPLRERKEDVPLLANHFLQKYAEREQQSTAGFTPEALDLLSCYHWPGNVRELENEIQRVLIQSDGERLIGSDILSGPVNQVRNLRSYDASRQDTLRMRMHQVEAFFIKEALKSHYGNRTRAAEHLGISREGLHKKMARYQIR